MGNTKFRVITVAGLFTGIFALALGAGILYFGSAKTPDVKIISAKNYDDYELGSVAGAAVGDRVNINSATGAQLEELPGVGVVTAGKIIAGRPYTAVEELLVKKIVGRSVYEKISPLVIAP